MAQWLPHLQELLCTTEESKVFLGLLAESGTLPLVYDAVESLLDSPAFSAHPLCALTIAVLRSLDVYCHNGREDVALEGPWQLNSVAKLDGERPITEKEFTGLLHNIQMCDYACSTVLRNLAQFLRPRTILNDQEEHEVHMCCSVSGSLCKKYARTHPSRFPFTSSPLVLHKTVFCRAKDFETGFAAFALLWIEEAFHMKEQSSWHVLGFHFGASSASYEDVTSSNLPVKEDKLRYTPQPQLRYVSLDFVRSNRTMFLQDLKMAFIEGRPAELHFFVKDVIYPGTDEVVFLVRMTCHYFFSPSRGNARPTQWRDCSTPFLQPLLDGVFHAAEEFCHKIRYAPVLSDNRHTRRDPSAVKHPSGTFFRAKKGAPLAHPALRLMRFAADQAHLVKGQQVFLHHMRCIRDAFLALNPGAVLTHMVDVHPYLMLATQSHVTRDAGRTISDPTISAVHVCAETLRLLMHVWDSPRTPHTFQQVCWRLVLPRLKAMLDVEGSPPIMFFCRHPLQRYYDYLHTVQDKTPRSVMHELSGLLHTLEIELIWSRMRSWSRETLEVIQLACMCASDTTLDAFFNGVLPIAAITNETPTPAQRATRKNVARQCPPLLREECATLGYFTEHLVDAALYNVVLPVAFSRPIPSRALFPHVFARRLLVENMTFDQQQNAASDTDNEKNLVIQGAVDSGLRCIVVDHNNASSFSRLYYHPKWMSGDCFDAFSLRYAVDVCARFVPFQPDLRGGPAKIHYSIATHSILAGLDQEHRAPPAVISFDMCVALSSEPKDRGNETVVHTFVDVIEQLLAWLEPQGWAFPQWLFGSGSVQPASPKGDVASCVGDEPHCYIDLFLLSQGEAIPKDIKKGLMADTFYAASRYVRCFLFCAAQVSMLPPPRLFLSEDHPGLWFDWRRVSLTQPSLPFVALGRHAWQLPSVYASGRRKNIAASALFATDPHDVIMVDVLQRLRFPDDAVALKQHPGPCDSQLREHLLHTYGGFTNTMPYVGSWVWALKCALADLDTVVHLATLYVKGHEQGFAVDFETCEHMWRHMRESIVTVLRGEAPRPFSPCLQALLISLLDDVVTIPTDEDKFPDWTHRVRVVRQTLDTLTRLGGQIWLTKVSCKQQFAES